MNVCPLCKGAGKNIVITRHSLTNAPKTAVRECLCVKSQFVSRMPEAKLLSFLENEYIPPKDIDPSLEFNPENLPKCPNLLIKNTGFEFFCLNLKAVIMQYIHADPAVPILACRAIDILKDYYVQQNDGTCPSLSSINKFSLVAVSFDTKEKNDILKTCIAELVYTRINIRKPTWIFIPTATLAQCEKEYSEDLEQYISASYKVISLTEKKRSQSKQINEAKKTAANFMR